MVPIMLVCFKLLWNHVTECLDSLIVVNTARIHIAGVSCHVSIIVGPARLSFKLIKLNLYRLCVVTTLVPEVSSLMVAQIEQN